MLHINKRTARTSKSNEKRFESFMYSEEVLHNLTSPALKELHATNAPPIDLHIKDLTEKERTFIVFSKLIRNLPQLSKEKSKLTAKDLLIQSNFRRSVPKRYQQVVDPMCLNWGPHCG